MVERFRTSNNLRVSNKRTKKLLPKRTKKVQRGGQKPKKKSGLKVRSRLSKFGRATQKYAGRLGYAGIRGLGKFSNLAIRGTAKTAAYGLGSAARVGVNAIKSPVLAAKGLSKVALLSASGVLGAAARGKIGNGKTMSEIKAEPKKTLRAGVKPLASIGNVVAQPGAKALSKVGIGNGTFSLRKGKYATSNRNKVSSGMNLFKTIKTKTPGTKKYTNATKKIGEGFNRKIEERKQVRRQKSVARKAARIILAENKSKLVGKKEARNLALEKLKTLGTIGTGDVKSVLAKSVAKAVKVEAARRAAEAVAEAPAVKEGANAAAAPRAEAPRVEEAAVKPIETANAAAAPKAANAAAAPRGNAAAPGAKVPTKEVSPGDAAKAMQQLQQYRANVSAGKTPGLSPPRIDLRAEGDQKQAAEAAAPRTPEASVPKAANAAPAAVRIPPTPGRPPSPQDLKGEPANRFGKNIQSTAARFAARAARRGREARASAEKAKAELKKAAPKENAASAAKPAAEPKAKPGPEAEAAAPKAAAAPRGNAAAPAGSGRAVKAARNKKRDRGEIRLRAASESAANTAKITYAKLNFARNGASPVQKNKKKKSGKKKKKSSNKKPRKRAATLPSRAAKTIKQRLEEAYKKKEYSKEQIKDGKRFRTIKIGEETYKVTTKVGENGKKKLRYEQYNP